jgi:hypothetical protein
MISVLISAMAIITGISISFAISFYLDKQHLSRKIERRNIVLARDMKLLAERERDLNLKVFGLEKKLRRIKSGDLKTMEQIIHGDLE